MCFRPNFATEPVLSFCPSAGSSSAQSPGSTAVAGSPGTGKTSTTTHSPSSASPPSASCSENSVIPHEVSGRTLRSLLSPRLYVGSLPIYLFTDLLGCLFSSLMAWDLLPLAGIGIVMRGPTAALLPQPEAAILGRRLVPCRRRRDGPCSVRSRPCCDMGCLPTDPIDGVASCGSRAGRGRQRL